MQAKITKDEYIENYLKEAELNPDLREDFERDMVILPCKCDKRSCQGWVALPRDINLIDKYNEQNNLYLGDESWNKLNRIIKDYISKTFGPYPHSLMMTYTRLQYGGHNLDLIHHFIIDLKVAFLSADSLSVENIKSVIRHFHELTFREAKPGLNKLFAAKLQMLQLLEEGLCNNKEISEGFWQEKTKSPNVKQTMAYRCNKMKELQQLHKQLKEKDIIFEHGQRWHIKGIWCTVIDSLSPEEFLLEKAHSPFLNRTILLSELLPLNVDDFSANPAHSV